jgi:hypothetical protein
MSDSTSVTFSSVIFIRYATPGEIVAAAVVLPLLGIIALALRFFARFQRKNGLGIDDWLLVPAAVCWKSLQI